MTSDVTGQDFVGVLIGDVTNNWTPVAAKPSGSKIPMGTLAEGESSNGAIKVADARAIDVDTVGVDFDIQPTFTPIEGIEVSFTLDGPGSVTSVSGLPADWVVEIGTVAEGQYSIAMAGTTQINPVFLAHRFTVNFTETDSSSSVSAIEGWLNEDEFEFGEHSISLALDSDGDGVPDDEDAFPNDPDESIDTDADGIGNNTDTDDDGDGVEDTLDAFPLDSSETLDTDGDGVGNNTDTDDDGDGVPDEEEIAEGSDPLSADSVPSAGGLKTWLYFFANEYRNR